MKVKARDLKLGDVVDLEGGGYMVATVVKTGEGRVRVVRPFVHTGSFSYTGGVLWYIGVEEVDLWSGPGTDREYERVHEGKVE